MGVVVVPPPDVVPEVTLMLAEADPLAPLPSQAFTVIWWEPVEIETFVEMLLPEPYEYTAEPST